MPISARITSKIESYCYVDEGKKKSWTLSAACAWAAKIAIAQVSNFCAQIRLRDPTSKVAKQSILSIEWGCQFVFALLRAWCLWNFQSAAISLCPFLKLPGKLLGSTTSWLKVLLHVWNQPVGMRNVSIFRHDECYRVINENDSSNDHMS